MAVEGIGNLVQTLADQLSGQTLNLPAGANTPGTGNAGSPAVTEDTFTPSTQSNSAQATAQDAGLFQVSHGGPCRYYGEYPVCAGGFQRDPEWSSRTKSRPLQRTNAGKPQPVGGDELKRACKPGTTIRARSCGASTDPQGSTHDECAGKNSDPQRSAPGPRTEQGGDPRDRSHRHADSEFQSCRLYQPRQPV